MNSNCKYISYPSTNSFSGLIYDYLSGKESLKKFYEHEPTIEGVKNAIKSRKQFATNRNLIHEVFSEAYLKPQPTAIQASNIN